MTLTADQRRKLKAQAHSLSPVVQTGSNGVTDAVVAETNTAIEHHELIKVRFAGADRDARKEMAQELAKKLKAELVYTIGAVAILYRENKRKAAAAKAAAKPAEKKKPTRAGSRPAPRPSTRNAQHNEGAKSSSPYKGRSDSKR